MEWWHNMTKEEMIEIIKAENPTIKIGNDDQYTELDPEAYEAQIAEWADARLAKLEKKAAEIQAVTAKAALLERLGITDDEPTLLLS